MMITKQQIIDALDKVRYPGTGKNLIDTGIVTADDIHIEGMKVSMTYKFAKANDPFIKSVVKASETAILTYVGKDVDIKGNIDIEVPEQHQLSEKQAILPGVKNIVAIFSGKGGVGKSTVTSNLAVALAQAGYKVGLLDADVFGPSIPKMFNCEDARPILEKVGDRELIKPIEVRGIKMLSMGFFVDKASPVLWRGSLACNALTQLMRDANWGELDYFLIDMPPGTSDIHLTMVQTIALTGAVVVTTPQQVAIADAIKGIAMFLEDKIDVPVLGLIENMSWFTPAELPNNRYYIFGKEGGKKLAEQLDIPLLGQIPLVQSICEAGDNGAPSASEENTLTGEFFKEVATKLVEKVEYRNKHLSPTKKVEMK
ncbi:P-loop NTPase [Falsiporphyromonas endometrii]|uniref:Iron-sulfur cluster carrier protein n=1 Tax=Falsiporphyromonas endometrii TaxID=1387297 RepID=A0ABV9K7E6_9PORP